MGYTQKQAAEYLGYGKSQIAEYDRGNKTPPVVVQRVIGTYASEENSE